MFFQSKKLIGLDIGSSTIKVAEVEKFRGSSSLISFAYAPTPPGCISSGEIVDPMTLAQVVSSLVSQLKTKRKKVSVGIWGTAVIVKKISIPKMDKKLVGEHVSWEAEQYIPFDINEINLGFHILKTQSEASEVMDVLLVGAKQDLVMQYAEISELAGLETAVADVSGFAIANCFIANYGVIPGERVALLNIGSAVTNFVVLESGEIIFSRDIPIGGFNYTNEIQKGLAVSVEEAESFKVAAGTRKNVPEEVKKIIESTNQMVCEEIRHTIDFFLAASSNFQFSACYYSGGSSRVDGLVSKLSESLGIPLKQIDPFRKMSVGSRFSPDYIKKISTISSVVIGLALRKVGDT